MSIYRWSAHNNSSYLNGVRSAKTLIGARRAAMAYIRDELMGEGSYEIREYADDSEESRESPSGIWAGERSIWTNCKWAKTY